ncbi:hypothetical protein HMPREF9946_03100 [Acetobacteraceae bacterium AT-5844]|nr:hypothetical protein HMPREF9946_03100 [Acetobacteraceae bacterium AT-5844]
MGWEFIERKSGSVTSLTEEHVTMSFRQRGDKMRVAINITRCLSQRLGWDGLRHFRFALGNGEHAGHALIRPCKAGEQFTARMEGTGGTSTIFVVPLTKVDTQPAKPVSFLVEGDHLAVEMPSWAIKAMSAPSLPPPPPPKVQVPFVSIFARVPDPNVGRRVG